MVIFAVALNEGLVFSYWMRSEFFFMKLFDKNYDTVCEYSEQILVFNHNQRKKVFYSVVHLG